MAIFDIILMSLATTIPILYTFPMILAHFFKIQGYKISDQTECNQLINKLNIRRSVFYQNGKPFGVFYGKWYIGYIYIQVLQKIILPLSSSSLLLRLRIDIKGISLLVPFFSLRILIKIYHSNSLSIFVFPQLSVKYLS